MIPGFIQTQGLEEWKNKGNGNPILVSSTLQIVEGSLQDLKMAKENNHISYPTLSHAMFNLLLANNLTKYFVKKYVFLKITF